MKGWFGRLVFKLNLPIIRRILNSSTRVRVIITDKSGQHVLLIKNLLSRQKWGLPGGGVKAGEPPQTAASRELKEELGLDLPPGSFEPVERFSHLETETKADWQAVILVCSIPKNTVLKHRRSELLEYSWFALDELPKDMADLATEVLKRHNS